MKILSKLNFRALQKSFVESRYCIYFHESDSTFLYVLYPSHPFCVNVQKLCCVLGIKEKPKWKSNR